MEVTDDGVALPPVGVSVLGVDVRRKVVGALRRSGDWTEATDDVLMGSGGNADAGTAAFPGVAGPAETLEEEASEGTRTFKPARFSTAFRVDCELPAGTSDFLALGATTAFTTDFFVANNGVLDFIFPLSKAGKSSDFKLD